MPETTRSITTGLVTQTFERLSIEDLLHLDVWSQWSKDQRQYLYFWYGFLRQLGPRKAVGSN